MKCDEKLLIVSPHSDDALFSCSHLLFFPEYEVQVLTVENDKKRILEDEKLYNFLNIPFYHLNLDFHDESYYEFHKNYKEVTLEATYEHLIKYFGEEKLNEIEFTLVKWIEKFNKKDEYKIVSPWGIGHPFHFFIKDILEKYYFNLWYYREFPHSYKRRSQAQVEKQKIEYFLKCSVPVQEFHDIKWKLASKFYRSQSGLQFFEQGYIKKELPEEIYLRKT
jgi:hypothetical protein